MTPDVIILGQLVICGPKMMPGQFYHVQTPGGPSMTFLAGGLLPDGDGYVCLTSLDDNKPLFQVPRQYVRESSPEETARFLADIRAARAVKPHWN
jgi:hypothetical protein